MRALRTLIVVLLLGCGGLRPVDQAEPAASAPDPRCLAADAAYRTWHTVGVVFTSLGTAAAGSAVASEFFTDNEWVPVGVNLFGIASQAVGFAGHMLADDAAEEVLLYCGRGF